MGIFIIIALYLTINYAYVKVIGFEELKESKNVAAIMASKIFGVNAERILSVLLFLSVLAYINALLLSNPRVMVAMSEDKILPSVFQKRNNRGALTIALTIFAGVAAVVVFWAKKFAVFGFYGKNDNESSESVQRKFFAAADSGRIADL